MTPDEAMRIVGMLRASFPSANLDEYNVAAYAALFMDLSVEAAERAVLRLVGTRRFFPSVAEIRLAVAAERVAAPSVAAAWEEVLRQVRLRGRARTPKFSHPLVARAVDAVGWLAICDSDAPGVERAHFCARYKELVEQATDASALDGAPTTFAEVEARIGEAVSAGALALIANRNGQALPPRGGRR